MLHARRCAQLARSWCEETERPLRSDPRLPGKRIRELVEISPVTFGPP